MWITWIQIIQVLVKLSQSFSFFQFQFFFQGLDFNGHYQTVQLPHSPRPTLTQPHSPLPTLTQPPSPPPPLTQPHSPPPTHTYLEYFPTHPHHHPLPKKILHPPNIMPHNVNFLNSPTKRRNNFSTILQKNFSIFKFQECLSNFRKLISRNKEFKF